MDKKNSKPRMKDNEFIELAKKQGRIKTYTKFCKTKEAKEYALTKEEIDYYTSKFYKKGVNR